MERNLFRQSNWERNNSYYFGDALRLQAPIPFKTPTKNDSIGHAAPSAAELAPPPLPQHQWAPAYRKAALHEPKMEPHVGNMRFKISDFHFWKIEQNNATAMYFRSVNRWRKTSLTKLMYNSITLTDQRSVLMKKWCSVDRSWGSAERNRSVRSCAA